MRHNRGAAAPGGQRKQRNPDKTQRKFFGKSKYMQEGRKDVPLAQNAKGAQIEAASKIGRASCRERVY
jgi:hypothetical protein